MASNHQYLSKGFYQYAQNGNPVSVKNYMFIRKNGKKCLLLCFFNDLEYTVDAMRFTVVQMDSAGKVIADSEIAYDQMNFSSGDTYVTTMGIVVDEYCADFRVRFSSVRSGKYEYYTTGGQIAVRYLRETPELEIGGSVGEYVVSQSVKKRKFGKTRAAVLMGILGLVVMLVLSVLDATARDYKFNHPEPAEQQITETEAQVSPADTAAQEL